MVKYKKIYIILLFLVSILWTAIIIFPKTKTKVVFCNVGQGDASLITHGFEQVLIDGGPDERVLECLSKNMPFNDKQIEAVFLTHGDADHLTGLLSVFEQYKVKNVFLSPAQASSLKYSKLLSILSEQAKNNANINKMFAKDRVKIGNLYIESIWPEKSWTASKIGEQTNLNLALKSYKLKSYQSIQNSANGFDGVVLGDKSANVELNMFSIVLLIIVDTNTINNKQKKLFFMGDADQKVQKEIFSLMNSCEKDTDCDIYNNIITGIDILKFPHHGSKTGISREFLQFIKPKEAIISVGKNSYGHPTKEALDLLNEAKIKVRRTDLEGNIEYNF
jgi:beta-lactamase superfamily II metal-dependent hydrolase